MGHVQVEQSEIIATRGDLVWKIFKHLSGEEALLHAGKKDREKEGGRKGGREERKGKPSDKIQLWQDVLGAWRV